MKKHVFWQFGSIITMVLLFSSCKKNLPCNCTGEGTATTKVFTTGLNNPRGLKFGPDGYLYVAEGGTGGTNSSVGQCDQVVAPIGPYLGSTTGGRISRISPAGARSTVTDQLPSTQNQFGDISGVSDVAFLGDTLYALITGGGCSHGVPSIPNSVVRINKNNSWTRFANLSSYVHFNPVKNPEPDDFEPDGDFYSMIALDQKFYAVEANHGELVRILPGNVSRVADISATQGHIVPTVVAYRNGYFYVGNLNVFPIVDGSSKILRISPTGQVIDYATGFTTILGLTFDDKGRLYVLENTTGNAFPTPGTGKIIRLDADGSKHEIVTGLSLPTGLTYGPDKKLYVSVMGFGPGAIGGGQVVQVTLYDCDCALDNLDAKTRK